MTLAQINILNIGLMLLAAIAAFALPFELFLFAYAVLGPLHYLTQISWLHDRGYFAGGDGGGRREAVLLVGLAALTLFGSTFVMGSYAVPALAGASGAITFAALGFGLVFALARTLRARLAAGAAVVLAALALADTRALTVGCAVLVPTIVHVFLFTGLFILAGAVKSRSASGRASLAVYLGCAAACLLVPLHGVPHVALETRAIYPIGDLNCRLVELFGLAAPEAGAERGSILYPFATIAAVFEHEASFRATRLIAFAYTYHYLNWFSKTQVIRWHEVPRLRFALVIAAWLASVALYAWDFTTGLAWLYLLSLAHVFLEFPLDWRALGGVLSAGARRLTGAAAPPARSR